MTAYDRLAARATRLATLGEAQSMLSWDASAVMPKGGAAARGDQFAVLASLSHGLATAPEIADDLAEAEANPPADPWQAANLRLMRAAHTRATALPNDLVEALARVGNECEQIWRGARANADFAAVRPKLTELMGLVREKAQAYGAALGLSPYDAMIDTYQRGITSADATAIFAEYETFLRDALPRVEALQNSRPAAIRPAGPFPEEVQEALCRRLSLRTGLEAEHSRLDRSTHPFCGGTRTDVRITTRYSTEDFGRALMGVLHETGHALYERGLPVEYARQPVGEAAGMAAHESQSLIIEMQACRSEAFLRFLGPELHTAFGGDAAAYSPENLGRLTRRVSRGFIRVDADEMTYPAHVILRFRFEQALMRGDLSVADLPGAWAEGMQDLLGITPPDDAQGVLQDIHWYCGIIGYFPSYSLGAMAAAQLMTAARRDVPGLDDALALGDFSPLLGWLRVKVHSQGSRFGFNDLLRHATGKPLDPADFRAHLTARYLV